MNLAGGERSTRGATAAEKATALADDARRREPRSGAAQRGVAAGWARHDAAEQDPRREPRFGVVLLHDPFWAPRAVQSIGAPVVMVGVGARVRPLERALAAEKTSSREGELCDRSEAPPAAMTALHPGGRALDAPRRHRALAVSIHDVEPASFERCALMRDWLSDLGVARVTLLVIPAPQLHPFTARSPQLANWLLDRVDAGDAVAQHGLQHRRTRPPSRLQRPLRGWQGGVAAEYPGLDTEATIASVDAGHKVLTAAGLKPRGFVAPGYAYTNALREHLATRFDWWATLLALRGNARASGPALCLGTSTPLKRATSPALVRAGAVLSGKVLRLDLHPADFDHPRHVLAVERVLKRATDRVAVTYDDLC